MDDFERGELPPLLRAGTMGAAAACVVGTPLDVARHSAQAAISKQRKTPAGLAEALRAAAQAGVPGGLWRGLAPSLTYSVLAPGTFLLSYELLKGDKTPLEAAVQARFLQVLLLQPFEFVRTCRQAQALLPADGAIHLERTAWRMVVEDGGPVKALWRGIGPTLARDVVFSGMFLAAFIGFDRYRRGSGADRDVTLVPAWELAAFGAGAAAAAAVVTQPLDVVKTRMQARQLVQSNDEGYRRVRIPRFFRTLNETRALAGVAGLWTGCAARVAHCGAVGLVMGSLCEFAQYIADDSARPVRKTFVLPPDPSSTIVHPRATKAMFIEVKGG